MLHPSDVLNSVSVGCRDIMNITYFIWIISSDVMSSTSGCPDDIQKTWYLPDALNFIIYVMKRLNSISKNRRPKLNSEICSG